MIKNFILYCINQDDALYTNIEEKYWLKMLHLMYKQLEQFYPEAKIHVMTNKPNLPKNDRTIIHYSTDLKGYVSKFKIYNLIDEPAMYLDLDVVLLRKFENEHLNVFAPFNMYDKYKVPPAFSRIPGLEDIVSYYSNAIIWVPEPNPNMEEDLIEIHMRHFDNQEELSQFNVLAGNDEHATAVYIKRNNLKMRLFKEVNQHRVEIDYADIKNYQSVHYGCMKNKLPSEVSRIRGKFL